jgi:CheY-like chemotaxis protein
MAEKKKVLVVEDESLTAMALGAYIEALGFAVLEFCATGEDAVERAKSEQPDIVFMDIRLSGKMDGVEAAARINRDRAVPIILISGYAKAALESNEYQPAGYLSKPIDFEDIDALLAAIG